MSRHLFAQGHHDRHVGIGRGENLPGLAMIAGGAAIERLFDPCVRDPAALGDGGCEIGMAAAPVPQGCDVDLEEACNVARLGAETAELEGLGCESRVVGWRRWPGGCRRRGAARRKFPVIDRFYFFGAVFGGFMVFFRLQISNLCANSLILRNREFSGAEQGIRFAGTGNSGWAIAGVARGDRSHHLGALGQAEGSVEQRHRGRE